jgi:hypothetical protein
VIHVTNAITFLSVKGRSQTADVAEHAHGLAHEVGR